MARPGVTYSEVAAVAQQLVAAGQTPTLDSLRGVLRSGSHTTLGAHLRRWKAQQDPIQQIATREQLPEPLIATLKGLWTQVMDQTEAKIQQIEQIAQADRSALQLRQQTLESENAQWQQRYHQLQQDQEGLFQEKGVLESQLHQAHIHLAALEQKNQGLAQQNQQAQSHHEALRHQNQQIQANLEHYRAASQEQRLIEQQRNAHVQQELTETLRHVQQTLNKASEDHQLLQQQYRQTAFEKEALHNQLEKIETQYNVTSAQLMEVRQALAQASQAQQHWHEQYQTLTTKAEKQHDEFVTAQAESAMLRQQHHEIQQALHAAHRQNENLAHEKWILGEEKSQLQNQLKQMQSML